MQSQTLSVSKLWALGRFEPARVQRGYRWGLGHQAQLLLDVEHELYRSGLDPDPIPTSPPPVSNDIDLSEVDLDDLLVAEPVAPYLVQPRANQPTRRGPIRYFLGHMVFGRTRADDKFDVYDGQQRLTTLAVLLAVLRDKLIEEPVVSTIRDCLLQPNGEPRLSAPTPGGTLRRITRPDGGSQASEHADDTSADASLRDGAQEFATRIEGWSVEKTLAVLRYLLSQVHVTITFVEERRVAETAYMTGNNRGLSLDVAEVVKGHLVRVVSDVSHEEGRQLATAWNRLHRQTGAHLEGLLGTVRFLLRRTGHSSDLGVDLMDEFPDGPSGAQRAKQWVHHDLPRYWRAYSHMALDPESSRPMRGAELEIRQLSFLPWDEWRGVALWLLEAMNGPPLDKRMRQLKQSCYTMQLLGWSQKEEPRQRRMSEALDELNSGLSPFRPRAQGRATKHGPLYMFGDDRRQAKAALMAPLQGFERYRPIARLTEVVLWLDAGLEPAGFVGGGTVEHVLPRAPGFRWDGAFPKDVARERLKNRLGNLCMLPPGLNQELGTQPFIAKRTAYLRLKPTWRSAHDVARHEAWTSDVINKRTHRLAQLLATHLGLS